MRYASVDIETTGLNPDACDVLEFGMVLDDLSNPDAHSIKVEDLPSLHFYVLPWQRAGTYRGEPYALSMHPQIFRRIATKEKGYTYLQPEEVSKYIANWLREQNYVGKIQVAGKNFASFDWPFLKKNIPDFEDEVRIAHRVIDPAMLFWNPARDEFLPNLDTCLQRAKIEKTVSHTALDDARDVCTLIRLALRGYGTFKPAY